MHHASEISRPSISGDRNVLASSATAATTRVVSVEELLLLLQLRPAPISAEREAIVDALRFFATSSRGTSS